jgi:glycosyltransferase involved in cell wall biosynthesis
VIATFWTTLRISSELALGPLAHFCQGYEGDLAHLAEIKPEIEAAYQRNLPTLVVSPHLGVMLQARFGRQSRVAPPPLDPMFRPAFRLGPHRTPRIVISGIFEAHVKGIPTALAAVALLRRGGRACRVVRVSVLPLSTVEAQTLAPDKYFHAVVPRKVARVLRRADLLLFPSLEMEGFGLPVLEAMGAGVPVVASQIPSIEFLGGGAPALAPVGDVAAFAAATERLLSDPAYWHDARRRGLTAARRFAPETIARELDEAVTWARSRSTLPAA